MSSALTVDTITINDVRRNLSQCLLKEGSPIPFYGRRDKRGWGEDRRNREERYERNLTSLCCRLRECTRQPYSYLVEMDKTLSPAFKCKAIMNYGPREFLSEDEVILKAHGILRRLPQTSLELIGTPSDLSSQYFGTVNQPQPNGVVWENLSVSRWICASIVQLAIFGVAHVDLTHNLDSSVNILAQLFETASRMAAYANSKTEMHEWYIVRGAIWSSWQRALNLCLYFRLCINLRSGLDFTQSVQPYLRDPFSTSNSSILKEYNHVARKNKAESMCSWNFGLLLRDPVSLGMDFRTFHIRYQYLWGHSPSRCTPGFNSSCLGQDPDECRRFKGLTVSDQTMHDDACTLGNCTRLVWDEKSYLEEGGARAISVDEGWKKDLTLKYCRVSQTTLAISHVWSHGQGGRPHDGINECLHKRYVRICQDLGCSEYWWDAACIPEDHELRTEAINNINYIFESSKVVLVCDRDFMNIDISCSSMQLLESILATALVCDWNSRAWTFLESFRGRHQIHLLCQDNKTINFRDMCNKICDYGSIDLAILSLSLEHMLPQGTIPESGEYTVPRLDKSIKARSELFTYLTKETAGAYLSYRPASRPGDDVVIWSLLTGATKFDTAEDLWLSSPPSYGLQRELMTGFLISSAPRSSRKGLSWLPTTPYFKSIKDVVDTKHGPLRAFSSGDSAPGIFSKEGLRAHWLVFEFDRLELTTAVIAQDILDELTSIAQQYLGNSRWGALLQPALNIRYVSASAENIARYKGEIDGTPLAVIGSDSSARPSHLRTEDSGWTWKGVFVWRLGVELPEFAEVKEFLIR